MAAGFIYNTQGKKYKTLSVSTIGAVLGYSSSFFESQNGSWIYLWDAEGKKINTISKNTVGEVIGALVIPSRPKMATGFIPGIKMTRK